MTRAPSKSYAVRVLLGGPRRPLREIADDLYHGRPLTEADRMDAAISIWRFLVLPSETAAKRTGARKAAAASARRRNDKRLAWQHAAVAFAREQWAKNPRQSGTQIADTWFAKQPKGAFGIKTSQPVRRHLSKFKAFILSHIPSSAG